MTVAEKPATTRSTNREAIKAAREAAKEERKAIAERLKFMDFVLLNVVPVLPEGVEVPTNQYGYYPHGLELTIPEVEGRQWEGMDGTAGIIYRTRKALGIEKLNRNIYAYGDRISHSYWGYMPKEDGKVLSVTIRLGSQLPNTCRIEWTEETKTVTEKVGKVVCDGNTNEEAL